MQSPSLHLICSSAPNLCGDSRGVRHPKAHAEGKAKAGIDGTRCVLLVKIVRLSVRDSVFMVYNESQLLIRIFYGMDGPQLQRRYGRDKSRGKRCQTWLLNLTLSEIQLRADHLPVIVHLQAYTQDNLPLWGTQQASKGHAEEAKRSSKYTTKGTLLSNPHNSFSSCPQA